MPRRPPARTGSASTTRRAAARSSASRAAGAALPGWAPPVIYAVAVLALFHEVFFSGGHLLGNDTLALSYFARDFYTHYIHTQHRFPLWDPLLFGGIPFVDGMHGDIFYPPTLALFPLSTRALWDWKMILHVYAAGLFTYLWLRGLGLRRGPALFGGLVYMMGADLVSLVFPGGDGKLFVSALAPLVFWLLERCMRRRGLADFALFALGIALVMFTSHMQCAYFLVWGITGYFFFRMAQIWRADRQAGPALRLFGLFALAGTLGVTAAAAQVVPPLEYLRNWSHRAEKTVQASGEQAYLYSATYSLHAEEAVSLVVPEFIGDNAPTEVRSGNTYWGRNGFKLNHEYAGLVPLLLLPLLLIRRRRAETWFFVTMGGLALLYALGATTPFFHLFYLIPGVKLFRAPSIIIFLYGLSIATLGAMAVQRMLDWATTQEHTAFVRRALWISAGVFLVLALAQSGNLITNVWQSLTELEPRQIQALNENLPNIRLGFWLSCVLATLVAATWEAVSRGFVGARDALIAFCLLAALDLYRVDRPFVRATVLMDAYDFSQDGTTLQPDDAIRFLQQAATHDVFRVHDIGWTAGQQTYRPNVFAIHGLEELTGHHGNEMGRYRDLMGGADPAPSVLSSRLRLLRLANVEYLVSPAPQRLQIPGYDEVYASARAIVYRDSTVLPRAYLAGDVRVVPDANAVDSLLAENFDAGHTVLLPEALPAGISAQPDPQGEVRWGERADDHYTLNVTTDRPALLVISENYYPAWHAEVDGAASPLLRANYTFRAVPITAGQHQVRLYYESASLRNSAWVSVVTLLLLLGISATGLRQGRGARAEA